MTAWLRRLFRRPPTIADCLHAARQASCEPTRAPDPVERAARNRADHYRALGEDPDAHWGPFDDATLGWAADRHPGDAA